MFHCIPSVINSYLILKTGLVAGFMNCMEDLLYPYGLYKMLLAALELKLIRIYSLQGKTLICVQSESDF